MRSGARRALVAVSVLAVAAGAVLWLSRVPIATHVIDRELAKRGVPARYHVADLGFGRQRLTDVVIGDPANPDLVADWVETHTDIGLSGPRLTAVRAGTVRLSARLADGKVSLGAIDRLLPPSSGGPFALPALDLAVADARIRLATPYGPVALSVAGQGRLDDGFRGRLSANAPRLAVGGCRVDALAADVAIRIARAAPRLTGPVNAATLTCGDVRATALASDIAVALSPALDHWSGTARLAAKAVTTPAARLARPGGDIRFQGDARRTEGKATLALAAAQAAAGQAGATRLAGTWRVAGGRVTLAGRATATGVALAAPLRARLAGIGDAAAGTPVAPLATGMARDLARAARSMTVVVDLALGTGTPTLLTVERAHVAAASGARATLEQGSVVIGHPAGIGIAGRVVLAGGGLPSARVQLAQAAPGAPVSGEATIARYARDGAALALTPVRFTAGGAETRITTTATLSGPLADGRVEGLRVPLDARWDGRGGVDVNRTCTPVGFERLAVSSLTLRAAMLRLCPTDGALVRVAGGGVRGGATLGATRLDGAIGGTPLRLDLGNARLALADRGFVLGKVAARIGAAGRETRIDAERLDGAVTTRGVGGRFAGATGQIANVPLVMSGATGDWRFADGALRVTGMLKVADAAETPRFQPLDARDVALRLAGGAIDATGTLVEPTRAVKVANVTIAHRLADGTGHARLSVPGITFAEGFQPELLTRLTFGVIADVRGTVSGTGDIAWNAQGVTSTGTFTTPGTDLAAAFGPVTGLAGTIRFTDLLALASAPGQVATVTSINPGIPVTDGRIVYRLLPDTRVQVDEGRWPFAGGTLTLEPTLLDFGADQERRMTFRVEAMEAGKFLQQFDFENLNATGTFDGVLPMVFDATGGRIADGRLAARPGGGSIAYLGELTEKDLGFWGNLAFQSLRSLNYRDLQVEMSGPLAGEMVTGVRFSGIRQGKGTTSNFLLRRLTRLPIVFNITIRAPFRGLIDSAASFYDPQRLVKRNLQALIDEQNRKAGVQPPASEKVP